MRSSSIWDLAVRLSGSTICSRSPSRSPWAIVELVRKGLLLKYIVASLFRVTWGFSLAVLVGVPLGPDAGLVPAGASRRSTR